MNLITISFVLVLLLFVVIGVLSVHKKREAVDDYLTAGHNTAPWLIGLSSVATNNSAYMFIGLVGYTWVSGISALWLALGWLFGDWLAWRNFHPRLRHYSEKHPVNTVPAMMSLNPALKTSPLRIIAALLTLIFLSIYAAAQLKAGSKALFVMFDWPMWIGAVLGALVVVLYSFAGGLRASIWTDVAQSFVMLFGMVVLCLSAMIEAGWPWALYQQLREIDPQLVRLVPDNLAFGFVAFVLGWVAAGLGVIGQPHILVRTIALRSPEDIPAARRVYFAWYLPFVVLTLLVGLYARVILGGEQPDPELSLPTLSSLLLPDVLTGMVLAAIFAATLSTADSMLLSCSAAISQDLIPRFGQSYVRTKIGTLGVTLVVLAISLSAPVNVFTLVIFAWSFLAGSLGPVIVVRVLDWPLTRPVALLMMAAGMITLWSWSAVGYSDSVYELLPALLVSAAVYGLAQLFSGRRLRPKETK